MARSREQNSLVRINVDPREDHRAIQRQPAPDAPLLHLAPLVKSPQHWDQRFFTPMQQVKLGTPPTPGGVGAVFTAAKKRNLAYIH